MSYLDEVKNSKDYNNYKLTADKVVQILDGVREERTKSRRRWIWELMQNAKDVPNKYDAVSIEITLSSNTFTFKHNGDPFLVGNITGLIQQVSYGKPSNNSNRRITGKFGTGFISTHLLSDIVTVEGVVEKAPLPPKQFKIELNRRGETSEELIPAIKSELEKLDHIETFQTISDYHVQRKEDDKPTVFTYPLNDEQALDAAKVGIEDMSNTLPQTLIFIDDQIKQVKINDLIKGIVINYERVRFEKSATNENIYFASIKSISPEETRFNNFVIYRDDEIDLAIEVGDFQNKRICLNEDSPKLFRDFPLIGSEKFYFPFILNGTKFSPTEKRDNILLTDEKSKKVLSNRGILEYAIEKSKHFAGWLIDEGYVDLSPVCQSRIPPAMVEAEVLAWYKEKIQKNYRGHLLELKLVETSGANLTIREAIIPKVSGGAEVNQKFWEVISTLFGTEKICKQEHLDKWHKFIGVESEIETWGDDIFFSLEDLLSKTQEYGSLENLTLASEDTVKINWLNSVYQFLIDTKQTDYFKKYKIVLNRKGEFKDFDELYIEKEGNIPDEFIAIYKLIESDWDDILVHRELINIDEYHSSKSIKDISDAINKVLNFEEKNNQGSILKTFIDRPDALSILKALIRLSPPSSVNTFQKQLFDFSKSYFSFEDELISLEGIQDFNFSPAKKLLIKLINTKIQACKTTNNLQFEEKEKSLNQYLTLLSENAEFKHLLEYGNIVPNEYNELLAYEDLFNSGSDETPLDKELINILKELNPQSDWKKILKADYISVKLPNTKTFDELANEIQSEIDSIRGDQNRGFEENSPAILKLINWCSLTEENKLKASQYFGTFLTQKDKIFVNISLEDKAVGGNVMKLLQHKDKLATLSEIADTGVNLDDLKEIANISKIVGMSKIKREAEKLQQEKEDFEFKKAIGENIELSLIDAFKNENLNYKIDYQGIGNKDVIIRNPDNSREYYIEVKSLSPTNPDKNVRISIPQGQKAIDCIPTRNYSLAVLVRPNSWDDANVEFIKQNLKCVINVGNKLQTIISKNDDFESLLTLSGDLSLEFEDTRRKIKMSENYWRSGGVGFGELVREIKQYLGAVNVVI